MGGNSQPAITAPRDEKFASMMPAQRKYFVTQGLKFD